jgi:hypothetical protein
MNKGGIIFLLLSVMIVLITSCNKSNFDQEGFPGLRCNPGNIEYIADTSFYTRNLGTTIYGQTNGKNRVVIYLPYRTGGKDSTGLVSVDTNANTAYYLDGVNTYQSIEGSVNITEYYNDSLAMMSGSFGFVGRNIHDHNQTINVSYGFFNNIPRH